MVLLIIVIFLSIKCYQRSCIHYLKRPEDIEKRKLTRSLSVNSSTSGYSSEPGMYEGRAVKRGGSRRKYSDLSAFVMGFRQPRPGSRDLEMGFVNPAFGQKMEEFGAPQCSRDQVAFFKMLTNTNYGKVKDWLSVCMRSTQPLTSYNHVECFSNSEF